MTRKLSRSVMPLLAMLLVGLSVPLVACEKSGSEKVADKAKDALDMRDHEQLRDAGEEVRDALDDAGQAVKDEVEDLKEKVEPKAE
jgi:gas vesicle protein